MNYSSGVDLFLTYKFLRMLTTPFNKTEAFKLGIIDESGEVLKTELNDEEKKAYSIFTRLVFNLKKLLEMAPGGKSKLASYAAALFLIRESAPSIAEKDTIEYAFKKYLHNYQGISRTVLNEKVELLQDELELGTIKIDDELILITEECNKPVGKILNTFVFRGKNSMGNPVYFTAEEITI